MRLVRFALLCAAALVLTGSVQATAAAPPAGPKGLKPFLLRADEAPQREFTRTPSFAWLPVRGAIRYEFELAKNDEFSEGSIFWSDSKLKSPAVSIPLALPWQTGNPYAIYARVRAITPTGVTKWSAPYGFNVRWGTTPQQLPSDPGMSRWSVVPGATSYHVWFVSVFPGKVVATKTNAVDHREFYTFHQQAFYSGTVRFRVRAVRNLYGAIPTGLPAVTHGPWSPVYTSVNPPIAGGVTRPVVATSDSTTSTASEAGLHRLTPAFAFTGTTDAAGSSFDLYRVYVFTDRDCVNTIFRGAIVGSPAYVPRLTGPLKLPQSSQDADKARTAILTDGTEPKTFTADGLTIQPTEQDTKSATPAGSGGSGSSGSGSGGAGSGAGSGPADPDPAATPPSADTNLPSTPVLTGAPVDLWESGWPNGRFYWTVVPVRYVVDNTVPYGLFNFAVAGQLTIEVDNDGFQPGLATVGAGANAEQVTVASVNGRVLTLAAPLTKSHMIGSPVVGSGTLKYYDVETPQDACAAGRVLAFGKTSEPATARQGSPFVSGLSPKGRLTAAVGKKPAFYGTPLVAWEPALGADQYQVQWSKKEYPWKTEGEKLTYATSAMLPVAPGRWYYRVRGINFSLPGTARAMTWSAPNELRVAKPTFAVVKKSKRSRG
jgi:hypothetical protein